MNRTVKKFPITIDQQLKDQLISWASTHETFIWLDSNAYSQQHSSFEAILAVGVKSCLESDTVNAFEKLRNYIDSTPDYLFGYLGYDLKNDIEALESNNHDGSEFPDLYFFQPRKIFILTSDAIELRYEMAIPTDQLKADLEEILATDIQNDGVEHAGDSVRIKLRIHKDEYYDSLNRILEHIHHGDIYEANFCQEFFATDARINPLKVYKHLNSISKPPFATFLKIKDKYLISASPERYLKKSGNKLISQPIKGTQRRAKSKILDSELVESLKNSEKDRAENIMIVDLVRNDLSRISVKGSVHVEELCEVYSFEQVHQLISTIACEVDSGIHPVDIIKSSFPMGSMTGAPKISAMKIIEELETSKRGLYSGTVGYLTPDRDFDFNVVIRSILYNEEKSYVSYSVGGAITSLSDPEQEYEECLVKAKAMREVLIQPI